MTVGVPCPGHPGASAAGGRPVCLVSFVRSALSMRRRGGGASLCTSGSPRSGSALSPQRTVCKPALPAKMNSSHPPLPRLSAWLVTWAGPAAKPLQP